MEIEIIGAESLDVRGLCCFVAVAEQRILIDPGIALGFLRRGQAPHPVQVAVDEVISRFSDSLDRFLPSRKFGLVK